MTGPMPHTGPHAGSRKGITLAGLGIALFVGPALLAAQKAIWGPIGTVPQVLFREAMLIVLAGLMILLIRKGERLPLSSIGLTNAHKGRTVLWGLALFAALGVGTGIALGLLHVLGLSLPKFPGFAPPPLVMTLIVLRAGIVEELFYRGYAIERIEALTRSKALAAGIPLLVFAGAHFNGGIAGMLIALVLGAVLTAFYMWKRNLAANMIGHFIIDFIPNVLLRSLG